MHEEYRAEQGAKDSQWFHALHRNGAEAILTNAFDRSGSLGEEISDMFSGNALI
jgi:hypothetical protein